jgi:hypothetical protein
MTAFHPQLRKVTMLAEASLLAISMDKLNVSLVTRFLIEMFGVKQLVEMNE